MRRVHMAVLSVAIVSLVAAGCSGEPPAPDAGPAASGDVDVTLTTTPNPPVVTGENTFEVMVMSGSQPVTDGDVSVEFYMPAMGNMSEMRNTMALMHEGGGRYRGTGQMMMAGDWTATVTVMRGGQTIGSEQIPVTAK
jgi:hypothetical protein